MSFKLEYIKPFIYIVIGFTLAFIFLNGCNDKQQKLVDYKPIYDSLSKKYVELKKKDIANEVKINEAQKKVDSLKLVKSKFYPKYITAKVEAIKDTSCMGFVAYCDSLDNINTNIIKEQDSTIIAYKNSNETKDAMINTQDLQIQLNLAEIKAQKEIQKETEKTHKKELRKQKVKTFLVGSVSILTTTSLYILLSK